MTGVHESYRLCNPDRCANEHEVQAAGPKLDTSRNSSSTLSLLLCLTQLAGNSQAQALPAERVGKGADGGGAGGGSLLVYQSCTSGVLEG